MNHYAIWVDLAPGAKDLDFVAAVDAYLGRLRERGEIESWRVMRRKFGFGPDGLGEFFLDLEFRDLAQLDAAFHHAATRGPEIEALHGEVFSRVSNFRSALYRDFPDPVRI
jgi:hypothetical protein